MISNTAALYGVQALNYATSLASIPLLVAGLGIDGYGRYSIYFTVSILAGVVIEFGSALQVVPEVAGRTDVRRILHAWSSLLSLQLGVLGCCVGALALAHVLGALPNGASLTALMLALGIGGFNSLAVVSIQLGMRRNAILLLPTFLSRGVFVVFLFVRGEGLSVNACLWAYALCTAVLCLGSNLSLYRHIGRLPALRVGLAARRLKLSASYAGIALFGAVYANMNILLLSLFVGHEAVGLYAIAEKLRNALNGVLAPLGLAMFAETASRIHSLRQRVRLAIAQAFVVGCAVALALYLVPVGTAWLAGSGDRPVAALVVVLLLATVPAQLRTMLNLQVLVIDGRAHAVAVQVGCMALLHVSLVAALVPPLGVIGMSTSVLATECAALLATIAWVVVARRRHRRIAATAPGRDVR